MNKRWGSLIGLTLALILGTACAEGAPSDDLVTLLAPEIAAPQAIPSPQVDILATVVATGRDPCGDFVPPPPEPWIPGSGDPLVVTETDWVRGPEEALVTIVEYGDFQCSACATFYPAAEELLRRYPDDVRLVFRHFPLMAAHDKSSLAAQAAEAAGAQGLFWEMHDLLFERQEEWRDQAPESFQATLTRYAGEIGLDVARFEADLESETYALTVETAYLEMLGEGYRGTPTIFINGVIWNGGLSFEAIDPAVQIIRLAGMYPSPPPMTIDPEAAYFARIITEQGDIVIELFARRAPETVNNFVYLACQGYYDDTTFYRVIPGFVAQAGDPTSSGAGGPGYTIPDETANGLLFDRPGLVSMAKTNQPDSARGQFFITYAPEDSLNGIFTVFGEVVAGMGVVEGLTPRDPGVDPSAPPGDRIETIVIYEQ